VKNPAPIEITRLVDADDWRFFGKTILIFYIPPSFVQKNVPTLLNQSDNIIHFQHVVNLKTIKTSPAVRFPVRFIRLRGILFKYENQIGF